MTGFVIKYTISERLATRRAFFLKKKMLMSIINFENMKQIVKSIYVKYRNVWTCEQDRSIKKLKLKCSVLRNFKNSYRLP